MTSNPLNEELILRGIYPGRYFEGTP